MLSVSRDELEGWTKPLCSEAQFKKKLENYSAVETSFSARQETCSGSPIQIHVEPSGVCNLVCPICPRGRGKIARSGDLSLETFEHTLEPLWDGLSNIILSGFGEPLLNPETPRMIGLATRKGVSTVMNSNGTLLTGNEQALLDSGLTLINLSMDGAVSKSCHKYTEENPFQKVVQGVESLRNCKDKRDYRSPVILGQFIVTEETIDEMELLEEWARRIGIERVRFKRMHHSMPGEKERQAIFAGHDLERMTKDRRVRSSEMLHWSQSDCSHPWDSFFLSCTGEAGLCSFDPHQVANLGFPNGNFSRIWNGESLKRIRRWHAGQEQGILEPCSRCNRLPGYFMPVEE
jgi:MoaA/NifB/PqqE/SkfB family radical SAM enzyme